MHDEALTREASRLFHLCSRFKGFYLAGGTALALQIGHRLSVDLDFFSESELPSNLLNQIKRVFREFPISVSYRSSDQLNLFVDGVKMTFFHFPYPVILPLKKFCNVKISSIPEIGAMKAFSIGKRLVYKDYVDWYFLLNEKHVTLKKVIDLSVKKFGGDFNDRLFLGQLVSMEDIPFQKIAFLRNVPSRENIENLLKKTVRAFAK